MDSAALWIVPWEDGPRGRTRACQKIGQTAIWGGSSTGMLPIVGGERRAAGGGQAGSAAGPAARGSASHRLVPIIRHRITAPLYHTVRPQGSVSPPNLPFGNISLPSFAASLQGAAIRPPAARRRRRRASGLCPLRRLRRRACGPPPTGFYRSGSPRSHRAASIPHKSSIAALPHSIRPAQNAGTAPVAAGKTARNHGAASSAVTTP